MDKIMRAEILIILAGICSFFLIVVAYLIGLNQGWDNRNNVYDIIKKQRILLDEKTTRP